MELKTFKKINGDSSFELSQRSMKQSKTNSNLLGGFSASSKQELISLQDLDAPDNMLGFFWKCAGSGKRDGNAKKYCFPAAGKLSLIPCFKTAFCYGVVSGCFVTL